MQSRQHQVASLRCLNGNLGGFKITYLAHHYNIWILAQERAQCLSKTETRPHIDLRLINAIHIYFNRIFRRRDIALGGIENIKSGIKRYSFTTTGWTSNQDHSLGSCQGIHIYGFLIFFIS